MLQILLWLTSCTTPDPIGSDSPSESVTAPPTLTTSEPDTGAYVVDMDMAPELFVVDSDYSFDAATFADVDGDGYVDAIVRLVSQQDASTVLALAHGPLQGAHLPSQADVLSPWFGGNDLWVVDADGVPPVDVVVQFNDWSGNVAQYVILGPWDGSTEVGENWRLLDAHSTVKDLDLDGIADWVRDPYSGFDYDFLEIRFGPIDRWDGPADVTVGPMCYQSYWGSWDGATTYVDFGALPDINGDGRPEVSIFAYIGTFIPCGGFTFSLPASGFVHSPFFEGADDSSTVWVLELSATPVGDWNGDGRDDYIDFWAVDTFWYQQDPHTLDSMFMSPVDLSWRTNPVFDEVLNGDPDLRNISALPFDLDGDGRVELSAFVGGATVIIPSQLAAFEAVPPRVTSLPGNFALIPFVDQGRASVAVYLVPSKKVVRVDLGLLSGGPAATQWLGGGW